MSLTRTRPTDGSGRACKLATSVELHNETSPATGAEPPRDVIDVDALMADLRRRVAEKKARGLYTVDALAIDATENVEPYRLEDLERLRELSVQRVDLSLSPSSKPLVGGLITRIKKILVRGASQPMYAMAAQSSQYNATLLGYVSQLAREITTLQRQVEQAQRDAQEVRHALAEGDVERQRDLGQVAGRVEEVADAIRAQLSRLDSAERTVEGLAGAALPERVMRLEDGTRQPVEVDATGKRRAPSAGSLARLRLAASEARDPVAQKRWAHYATSLGDALPLLLLGAGVGAALSSFPEGTQGVEGDGELAATAGREGRRVHHADPATYAADMEPGSLRGVLVTDLVERLDGQNLTTLARSIARALAPEGRVIVEGLNPAALWTLGEEVWRDADRLRPVHPDALRVTLEAAGLRVDKVEFIDAPDKNRLPMPAPGDPASETLRACVEQLNDLLFGARRYAVHAVR
jgi:hypothetical protein